MAGAHRRELEARDAVIARQAGTIAGQADRIAQLERRLGRDSSSSSKPPSSDSPYTKKSKDRSLREKTGRQPGKQPGAPGRTLGLADDPDETIECAPAGCGRCGDLREPAGRTERRAVMGHHPAAPAVHHRVPQDHQGVPVLSGGQRRAGPGGCDQPGGVRAGVPGAGGEPGLRASRAGAAAALLLRQMAGIKVSTRVDGRDPRPRRRRAGAVHGARPGAAAHRPGAERRRDPRPGPRRA